MNLRSGLVGLFCISALATGVRTASASQPLPDEVAIAGVEFVRIPAGEFWYSVETDYANLRPYGSPAFREVRIWLDEFYIGKY